MLLIPLKRPFAVFRRSKALFAFIFVFAVKSRERGSLVRTAACRQNNQKHGQNNS